jgi:hypothetical protein
MATQSSAAYNAKTGKAWAFRPAVETVFVRSIPLSIVVTRKPTRKSSTSN